MAIAVAPLTTTVMGSVSERQSGVASGINNSVSRTAGLLAIAIFGVVLLQTFSGRLERRLAAIDIPNDVRVSLYEQRTRLGALELPANLNPVATKQLQQAIAESFISGYRLIMFLAACLALGAAASSWLMIGKKKEKRT
jgi:hypothetical protein